MVGIDRSTQRTLTCYETYLPERGYQEVIVAALYRIWRREFPVDPVPSELAPGEEYVKRQEILRRLVPPGPFLIADRDFLRFCLTYIEKRIA